MRCRGFAARPQTFPDNLCDRKEIQLTLNVQLQLYRFRLYHYATTRHCHGSGKPATRAGRVNPRPVRVGYWQVRVRVDVPLPVTNPYPGRGFSRVCRYRWQQHQQPQSTLIVPYTTPIPQTPTSATIATAARPFRLTNIGPFLSKTRTSPI